GFQHGVETKYNPHNQYLSEFLKSGVIGIILFLCVILQQFRLALKNKNTIQLFFMFSIVFFFLSESVLVRLIGVVFFFFFIILFLCVILCRFKLSLKNKNTIQLFFMFSIVFFFLTESVLERQMGVVFFIFFTTLFLFMKENKTLE